MAPRVRGARSSSVRPAPQHPDTFTFPRGIRRGGRRAVRRRGGAPSAGPNPRAPGRAALPRAPARRRGVTALDVRPGEAAPPFVGRAAKAAARRPQGPPRAGSRASPLFFSVRASCAPAHPRQVQQAAIHPRWSPRCPSKLSRFQLLLLAPVTSVARGLSQVSGRLCPAKRRQPQGSCLPALGHCSTFTQRKGAKEVSLGPSGGSGEALVGLWAERKQLHLAYLA